jgi:23S rRNA (adenine2503-C2)-methyltransferase
MTRDEMATVETSVPSILDMDLPALTAFIAGLGQPRYRADQIWSAVYRRGALTFAELSVLPTALRETLASRMRIVPVNVTATQNSADASTSKSLLRLDDGELVETVLMRYDPLGGRRQRKTVCVSTQAGCAMGCVFCATGAQGFRRQLTPGEVMGQILTMARIALDEGSPMTNIVFMGMGEPLANYDTVHAALERITDPAAMAMSPRRITVSTVGLLPGMRRLARDHPTVNLAVSLHAPSDGLRRRLVPIPSASVAEIIEGVREHVETTGRRVSIEYVLMAGVNDSPTLARELARLLRDLRCQVNLIPLNPGAGIEGRRPSRRSTLAFQAVLGDAGIAATVRAEKGHDISAACGQLRGDRAALDDAARSPGDR